MSSWVQEEVDYGDEEPWWLRHGSKAKESKEESEPWWMRGGTGLGWQPGGEKDEHLSGEDTPPLPREACEEHLSGEAGCIAVLLSGRRKLRLESPLV